MFLIRMSAATSDEVAPAATTTGSAIMTSEARMALCYRLLGRLVTGLDVLLEPVDGERGFALGDGPDVHEARPVFGPLGDRLLSLRCHHNPHCFTMGSNQSRNVGTLDGWNESLIETGPDIHGHYEISRDGAGGVEGHDGAQTPIGKAAAVQLEGREV